MDTLVPVREQEERSAVHPIESGIEPVQLKHQPVYHALKRAGDILTALIAGTLLILPMLVIALIIKLDSPGPALFRQERMGRNGKPFTIYKFRTMSRNAPAEMASRAFSDSDSYITKIGAFLRRTSLDELPQLINILNGSMSLVGYRPVCLTEVELNDLREAYGVFAMRPGLTGLAQVSGRDNVSSEEKARIDAGYVRKCGIKLDIWCLVKTVKVVLSGEGVM